jgi:hypothetical protein
MSVHVCPKRIKDNFESKVVNEMGQATEKSHTTLIRKSSYIFSLGELFQSCYYDDLIMEIFYEIKIRKQEKQPRQLYPGFNRIRNEAGKQILSVYEWSFGQNGNKLVRVRDEDGHEIKDRI